MLLCYDVYKCSHMALNSHKCSFQARKPCLLAAWLPPATVLLGKKSAADLFLNMSCFCTLFQESEWGKGALGGVSRVS